VFQSVQVLSQHRARKKVSNNLLSYPTSTPVTQHELLQRKWDRETNRERKDSPIHGNHQSLNPIEVRGDTKLIFISFGVRLSLLRESSHHLSLSSISLAKMYLPYLLAINEIQNTDIVGGKGSSLDETGCNITRCPFIRSTFSSSLYFYSFRFERDKTRIEACACKLWLKSQCLSIQTIY
jgi:hypothetical protein